MQVDHVVIMGIGLVGMVVTMIHHAVVKDPATFSVVIATAAV